MLKLLNRITWALSIILAYLIVFSFIGINTYKIIDKEKIFFSLFFGIFLGLLIKKLIFSKNFIKSRLELFTNSLKKNYLNSNKENVKRVFSPLYINQKNNNEKKEIKVKSEKKIKKNLDSNKDIFMKKLEKVNIDNIKVVRFYPNSGEIFRVRSKNLLKILKIITNKLQKNKFKAGELEKYYKYIVKNYKSDLSRREYDKIRTQIKDFIEVGGEVELVKKD